MLIHIFTKFVYLILCCVLFGDLCTTMSVETTNRNYKRSGIAPICEELPLNVLKILHGPAFDARYMSIEDPIEREDISLESMDKVDLKRNTESGLSFYITDDHSIDTVLSEQAAWNIQWDSFQNQLTQIGEIRRKRSITPSDVDPMQLNEQQIEPLNRDKRENNKLREPWRCEKTLTWVNLGSDYHPSHLRTVECTKPKCWYGQYNCKPKQFVVKILKRHKGQCEDAIGLRKYGLSGKNMEVWRWVEKSVNFCCDCVSTGRYY